MFVSYVISLCLLYFLYVIADGYCVVYNCKNVHLKMLQKIEAVDRLLASVVSRRIYSVSIYCDEKIKENVLTAQHKTRRDKSIQVIGQIQLDM